MSQAMLSQLSGRGGFLPAVDKPHRPTVTPREKAAIIVRLLLAEGTPLKISGLPEDMQTALAAQMGRMRRVDRTTLQDVVLEFLAEMSDAPPVIMMTANEGSRHKAYAEMLGVVDYLRKPFAMEVMLESVARAIAGEQPT